MRIGIDVDGVLADFNSAYIARCIEVTGVDLFPPRPFDIWTWNYPESYGYTKAQVSAVWESIKQDELFWVSLEPYPGAVEFGWTLQAMSEEDLYFITSRPGVNAKVQTEAWLMAVLDIEHPTVLISSEKGLCAKALNLTHYVDDRTENLQSVRAESPDTITFRLVQTWNADVEGAWNVRSLPRLSIMLSGQR